MSIYCGLAKLTHKINSDYEVWGTQDNAKADLKMV
jgi:hypothetical protein